MVEDEASDWLQIWTTASSLDVKGKKAYIFSWYLVVFQIRSHRSEGNGKVEKGRGVAFVSSNLIKAFGNYSYSVQ